MSLLEYQNIIANCRTKQIPMTIRQFQTIFYVIIGLCILTIVLSFTSFDFIEIDTATSWTMKYFALPILIVLTPSSYFIYTRFIRQHEKKEIDIILKLKTNNSTE
jgi:hypothetical protein